MITTHSPFLDNPSIPLFKLYLFVYLWQLTLSVYFINVNLAFYTVTSIRSIHKTTGNS